MLIGNLEKMTNGLSISVDWLSFTIKSVKDWKTIAEKFGLSVSQFQDGLNGTNGYRVKARHMIYPISVLYDGREDMGIHVDVSGSAIGFFLQSYLNKNTCSETPFGDVAYEVQEFDDTVLGDVLDSILRLGQLTRLDLAIDDIGCRYFTLPEVSELFKDGLYVSKFRNVKQVSQSSKSGCTGQTVYLGSSKSDLMIRIYDKQAERNCKKQGSVDTPWTRWELQLRKERATVVGSLIAAGMNLPEVALGIFSNYLRFIKRDSDYDSRCSTLPKWLDFLAGIEKLRICQPVPEKSLDEKRDWIISQVAPTFSAICEVDGDLSFVYTVIEDGALRRSPELVRLVQKYQTEYFE